MNVQVALGVKSPPASAGGRGDAGSIPGSGRSLGEEHDSLLCSRILSQKIPMEPGATDHRVTASGITEATQRASTHVKGSDAGGRTLDRVEPGSTEKELLVLKGHFTLIVSIFHKESTKIISFLYQTNHSCTWEVGILVTKMELQVY